MKEKLIAWMNSRRYNSHLMRLIVGGYVAYLGIKIIVNQAEAGQFSVPMTLCALLLAICGVPITLISIYAVINGYSIEYKGKTDIFSADGNEETESGDTGEDGDR